MMISETTLSILLIGTVFFLGYLVLTGWVIGRRLADDILTYAILIRREAQVEQLLLIDSSSSREEHIQIESEPSVEEDDPEKLFARADELTQAAIVARSIGNNKEANMLFAAAREAHNAGYTKVSPKILTQEQQQRIIAVTAA